MINYFSISEAAKIVGLTTETLRHYDRIDLVKPCKKDQWSGYRYYSEQEIVRLNTIQALEGKYIKVRYAFGLFSRLCKRTYGRNY